MTDIADAILASVEVPERYALMDRCMQTENEYLFANECRIGYPNVQETFRELAKKHRLFIVSNAQAGYPQLCIEKLGLGDYIEGHLCFGDTGTSKGQTILTLIKKHKIGSCIYIGDTQGDMEACKEAGIPFVFCGFGLGHTSEWDVRIDSFEELLAL